MPGPVHRTEAHVLAKTAHTGDHWMLTCFSPTDGLITALLRSTRSHKNDTAPSPDLFDLLALELQHGRGSPGTGPWFVREHRILTRHSAIGRDYPTLAAASRLARNITRNPGPEDRRAAIHTLLGQAFNALERTGTRPELVYFKSLYCLARDEGLPIKQEWLPSLPASDQAVVANALRQPAESPEPAMPDLIRLAKRLESYLSSGHDLIFD
ncbi:MAG: hypothetical protein NTU80_07130 [Verrucomicrobia bacterium]|nr:hypothetical protein [Verrucomicrobiota bacterium]